MTAFTTETETYTSISSLLIWKQEKGHFHAVCRIVMATWEKKKATRSGKKKTKKKHARSFCGLGEVVEQPASHRWRRQNRNKVRARVRACADRLCVCVLETADWKNVGFFKSSQSHESM